MTWRSLAARFPGSQLARVVEQLHQARTAKPPPADLLGVDDADAKPRQGERWADVYGRSIGPCGARNRSGGTCKLPGVGVGGRCKFHGGASTGPRTAAGKARSALNGLRRSQNPMDLERAASDTDLAQQPAGLVAATAAPAPAEVATAPQPVAPATRPAAARRGILDQLLDDHLAGRRHWPVAAGILAAVDRSPKALTRIELEQALGDQRLGPLVDRLIACGTLAEVVQGRRLVLMRPRA